MLILSIEFNIRAKEILGRRNRRWPLLTNTMENTMFFAGPPLPLRTFWAVLVILEEEVSLLTQLQRKSLTPYPSVHLTSPLQAIRTGI